jgi:hypothetical protein
MGLQPTKYRAYNVRDNKACLLGCIGAVACGSVDSWNQLYNSSPQSGRNLISELTGANYNRILSLESGFEGWGVHLGKSERYRKVGARFNPALA